jgi:urea transport system ATP-binding protein
VFIVLNVESINVYDGAAQALRSVSLAATSGRVACLLGRNGVGKSSLLRAISAHQRTGVERSSGRAEHFQTAHAQPRQARHRLCVAGPRKLSATHGAGEPDDRFRAVARKLHNIPDEIFEPFPVLKTMMGRHGGDLSGGQQQQFAIGRALVTRPKHLVLDELTEGIQPSTIKDIGRAIDHLRSRGEMAIVLVQQHFEFARDLADDFAVMDPVRSRSRGKGRHGRA